MTIDGPKCLVNLAGRQLLDWQLRSLREVGIKNIIVVRGYKGEQLIGDGYRVIDNPRWDRTNIVGSLRCASEYVQGGAIVSYSDIVYHPSVVERLINSVSDIGITYDRCWVELWKERFNDPLDDAETFRTLDGVVQCIGQPASRLEEIQGQFMGLLKFTSNGWLKTANVLEKLRQSDADGLDMTSLIQLLVRSGTTVNAVATDGGWCEVDSKHDLWLYERRIREVDRTGVSWTHDWRWERHP